MYARPKLNLWYDRLRRIKSLELLGARHIASTERRAAAFNNRSHRSIKRGVENLFFALEVMIDSALGHAIETVNDILDARSLITLCAE